jgi:hypothetical protein
MKSLARGLTAFGLILALISCSNDKNDSGTPPPPLTQEQKQTLSQASGAFGQFLALRHLSQSGNVSDSQESDGKPDTELNEEERQQKMKRELRQKISSTCQRKSEYDDAMGEYDEDHFNQLLKQNGRVQIKYSSRDELTGAECPLEELRTDSTEMVATGSNIQSARVNGITTSDFQLALKAAQYREISKFYRVRWKTVSQGSMLMAGSRASSLEYSDRTQGILQSTQWGDIAIDLTATATEKSPQPPTKNSDSEDESADDEMENELVSLSTRLTLRFPTFVAVIDLRLDPTSKKPVILLNGEKVEVSESGVSWDEFHQGFLSIIIQQYANRNVDWSE